MEHNTDTEDEKKSYKIKDINRQIRKTIDAATLKELLEKSSQKFSKNGELPRIHLDSDGTEIDDEDYFQTLEPNTELICVFNGEQWIDPAQHYLTLSARNPDSTDSGSNERMNFKKLVGQMKSNVVLSDNDLELLSNMDVDNVADLIGEDLVEQLKEIKENSDRILYEKRESYESYELLKMIRNRNSSIKHNNMDRNWTSESESTTSLSTMSSFSSNIQN